MKGLSELGYAKIYRKGMPDIMDFIEKYSKEIQIKF